MRNIITITRRELQSYFLSPLAYIIMTVLLFILGLVFYAFVASYSDYSMRASMNPGFAGQVTLHDAVIRGFYSWFTFLMLLTAPILSMRVLAEERRRGTAELLLTAPITTVQLVVGKYLGSLAFAAFLLLVTLLYPLYLMLTGATLQWPALLAIYAGTLLAVGSFLAIGLFSSSLTSSQMVAGMIALVICVFFWLIGAIAEVGGGGEYTELLKSLSLEQHYDDFLKGIIDTGSVVFYLTFIAFGLFLTQRVIDSGRWR